MPVERTAAFSTQLVELSQAEVDWWRATATELPELTIKAEERHRYHTVTVTSPSQELLEETLAKYDALFPSDYVGMGNATGRPWT